LPLCERLLETQDRITPYDEEKQADRTTRLRKSPHNDIHTHQMYLILGPHDSKRESSEKLVVLGTHINADTSMIPFFSSNMNIPIEVFDVHEISNRRTWPWGEGS